MKLFEKTVDRLTGLVTEIGAQDGKLVHRYTADVEPSLDYTQELRNDEDYSKRGIKKSWWHVGHIPEVVALKMLHEDGFNAWTANAKEVVAFLRKNREKYGKLIVTGGRI
jgi:hypothetical protein